MALPGHLPCRQQRAMEEGPMLVSWDVAITIITEGNLGPAEEVREASHEGALMLGSDHRY